MIVELMQTHPRVAVILVGAIVSFFISLVNFLVLDKDTMRSLKERQKSVREQMKLHKHDAVKQKELSTQMLSHSMESMKHSFKPMLITMLPALIVIWFLRGVFEDTIIASSWIWYYIAAAIVSSLIFRKLFKLP